MAFFIFERPLVRGVALAGALSMVLCGAGLSGAAADGGPGVPAASPPAQDRVPVHRAGQVLNYSLHGDMAQAVKGHDVLGHVIDQQLRPTQLNGHERIAVRSVSGGTLTLHRSGSVVATVGGHVAKQEGSGLTVVNADGAVVRDKSTLAGLFLLPVSFFAQRAVNSGADLHPGESWHDTLQAKLFGMTQPPVLLFSVTGQRNILGASVFSIEASGTADMKELVFTSTGRALGYATGKAHVNVKLDYDRKQQRAVSMVVEVRALLHVSGPSAYSASVQEQQRYLVALDVQSMLSQPAG
jgi:hypothetical protein